MAGIQFLGKVASTLCIFVEITLSPTISEINVFLCFTQKFNDFWKNSPVDSANNLGVKNFIESALSPTISEINAILCFTQKLKIAAQNSGKIILGEKLPIDSMDTLCVINFVEIALSCTVSEILKIFQFQHEEKLCRLVNR